jgi:hypothetical protein
MSYRRIVGLIALALWLGSLLLPAVTLHGGIGRQTETDPGYVILLIGWLGPLIGQFGWFANPFLLWMIALLLLERPVGMIPGLIVLGLAMHSFWWMEMPLDAELMHVTERHAGFYLWIGCAVLLGTISICKRIAELRASSSEASSAARA